MINIRSDVVTKLIRIEREINGNVDYM